jgi:hypothetical protein
MLWVTVVVSSLLVSSQESCEKRAREGERKCASPVFACDFRVEIWGWDLIFVLSRNCFSVCSFLAVTPSRSRIKPFEFLCSVCSPNLS